MALARFGAPGFCTIPKGSRRMAAANNNGALNGDDPPGRGLGDNGPPEAAEVEACYGWLPPEQRPQAIQAWMSADGEERRSQALTRDELKALPRHMRTRAIQFATTEREIRNTRLDPKADCDGAVFAFVCKAANNHPDGICGYGETTIGDAIGRNHNTVARALDRLVASGQLGREKRQKQTTLYWPLINRRMFDADTSDLVKALSRERRPGRPKKQVASADDAEPEVNGAPRRTSTGMHRTTPTPKGRLLSRTAATTTSPSNQS
jgi:hypothetical protein